MENKFRVWDFDKHEMYISKSSVYLDGSKSKGTELVCDIYNRAGACDCSDDHSMIAIMAFTGISDVNNVDIYDGDFIIGYLENSEGIIEDRPIIVRIIQVPGGFAYTQDMINIADNSLVNFKPLAIPSNALSLTKSKILGNIYEHPVLLSE